MHELEGLNQSATDTRSDIQTVATMVRTLATTVNNIAASVNENRRYSLLFPVKVLTFR